MHNLIRHQNDYDLLVSTDELTAVLEATSDPAELSLTGHALRSLRAFFDASDHDPSREHWTALWAIASTMERMINGECPAKVFLSPVDPGVGKSQTCAAFAKALVSSAEHRDAGMLISVHTIAEAIAMATNLEDIKHSLCVLTSDDKANALGGAEANDAQVLITTQQRLGRLTEDRPFSAVKAFYFHGAPRVCRVWDESLLPGSAIVISADDLIGMGSRLRGLSPTLVAAIYEFASGLLNTEDGAAVDVPDFTASCGVSMFDLMAYLAADNGTEARRRDREVALALSVVNGRLVRVRRDGLNGSALLTYREELPYDLLPMLVLDASGRVRETYALWQASRNVIETLPAAARDYSPLTVKTWKQSGSKSGWEKNSDRLLAGIVATIESKPDETWLVVVHKPNGRIGDVEKALQAKLPADVMGRVAVTTWGRHTGSNEWRDVSSVILAGTLFYPDSHLTALHHLCADIPVERGLVSQHEVNQTARGEHRHLILQAICRGRVRRSNGNQCLPMTAYIIASAKSGIPAELDRIFPGCYVESWSPLRVEAKGKLEAAIGYLETAFEGGRTEVSYSEVYQALELDKANFNRRVAKTDDWRAAVVGLDAEIVRGRRGAFFVRLISEQE
jgi:hypothetical protein